MQILFFVCIGGAIGAGLRHTLNIFVVNFLGQQLIWATFTINVIGSLIMGATMAYILLKAPDATGVRAFIATGVLGGFTTFSTFSLDTLTMLERGDVHAALAYSLGSVVMAIAACTLGYLGIRALIQ